MIKDDVRMALRIARKEPVLTIAIVLMLTLGIGATTAIFSVVDGVLLAPLPFPEPDRVIQVWGSKPDRGWDQVTLTEANFWDLLDLNHSLESFGAWHGANVILVGGSGPEQVTGAIVSSGFFRALGVKPIAGQLFTPDDDANTGASKPVVLSYRLWMRRFGGDRNIVGKTISLASGTRTVIGILPAGTPWLDSAELFFPFVRRADANRGSFEYVGIGRMKPGVSMTSALADLKDAARQLEARYPDVNKGLSVRIGSSRDWTGSDSLRQTLWILLGSVGLLLVIACVNVANLLGARAAGRASESALRIALGATRGDLIRSRLMESVLLSVTGTILGWFAAAGLLQLVKSLEPSDIPRLAEATLNFRVFLFASIAALIVGVLTGLVPALRAPIADIVSTMRQGQRGSAGDRGLSRVRSIFVAAEIGLSLILLVGAGLLVRSLVGVLSVDRGFQSDNRILATMTIPAGYGPQRVSQIYGTLLNRLETLPELVSAATVSSRPLTGGNTGLGLAAADKPDAPNGAVPWATWRIVSKDYFKVMGLRVISGREFTPADQIGKPWRAVISKRAAELLWPGENPIGKTIILWKGQGDTHGEVVGVVSDMRERGLEAEPTLAVYFPTYGNGAPSFQVVMHTRTDQAAAMTAVRRAVGEIDKNIPISNVRQFDELITTSTSTRRLTMLLLTTFAGLALVLALAGVYGVLAHAVSRQKTELGVRLALGARHGGLLRWVVARGMRPVLAGIVVGLAAAFWLSKVMSTLLFGVTSRDPMTYITVTVAVLATAVLSCYLPARAVLRVDPVTALRAE